MKKLWMIAALSLPSIGFAADYGMAGSFGTQNEIRFVIKTSDYFIEPYLQYVEFINKNENNNEYEDSSGEIGVSLWKKYALSEHVYSQFGFQLGYAKNKSKSGYYYQANDGLSGDKKNNTMDGFAFAPGLGLFYELNKHLDVGLEVKYSIEKLKGTSKQSSSQSPDYIWTQDESVDIEQTSSKILTSATIRLYF